MSLATTYLKGIGSDHNPCALAAVSVQKQENVCGVQHYITLLRLNYNCNIASIASLISRMHAQLGTSTRGAGIWLNWFSPALLRGAQRLLASFQSSWERG